MTSTVQKIYKLQGTEASAVEDHLAVEEPLEIRLRYGHKANPAKMNLAVTMRTPSNDAELATGFLFTEGIINEAADIEEVKELKENVIQVAIKEGVDLDLKKLERNFYTTSSCGVCGKSSIDAVITECTLYDKEIPFTISPTLIYQLPEKLRAHQETFQHTGGIHATALFDLDGNLLTVREDVGRHNAFDKLVGAALQNDLLPLNQHIVLLSGRASFELVQKAAMAGVKMLAAVGAPSSLAVATADEFGMTLIGFLKQDRLNVYCGKERVS